MSVRGRRILGESSAIRKVCSMCRSGLTGFLYPVRCLFAKTTIPPDFGRGYVTDTHCGTNCQVTKDMTPDKKCVVRCVRKGSKYGLWVGDRVYVLEPQTTAARFAAKNVRVKGGLQDGTIHISAIEEIDKTASQRSANP
jgi:hypothetical protein